MRPDPMIYRGRGGAVVELSRSGVRRGQKWWFRFVPWASAFGPFPTKLKALIEAAHACGRSGAMMQWEPDGGDP